MPDDWPTDRPDARYGAATLRDFACALAVAAGLPEARARVMAEILVEADMMGRSTHGIEHLDWYLTDLVNGAMNKSGAPEVVADHGAAVTWDGHYLPGTWLVTQAMDLAFERSRDHPVVTVVIRDSHHVGFHAAYLRRATMRGLVMLLLDTNPYFGAVAPYGGRQAVFSPTPVSFGFPTASDPVLVDFALSSTSLTATERAGRLGEHLPHAWLLDHEGHPSDDPQTLLGEPRGSILPLGGADRGHKGDGLQFMVYALSAALGGFGVPASPRGYSSAVFLQLIDPEAFAGTEAFNRELAILIDACHASPPAPGFDEVLVPGERAMASLHAAERDGVALFPTVLQTLTPWAARLGVALPVPG
ncbi:MAG: Ldh family oxidoreductase [Proteobacteria bacterium]|nr:Ldh family oxidoreductase [Pseudomonadota bacterium]